MVRYEVKLSGSSRGYYKLLGSLARQHGLGKIVASGHIDGKKFKLVYNTREKKLWLELSKRAGPPTKTMVHRILNRLVYGEMSYLDRAEAEEVAKLARAEGMHARVIPTKKGKYSIYVGMETNPDECPPDRYGSVEVNPPAGYVARGLKVRVLRDDAKEPIYRMYVRSLVRDGKEIYVPTARLKVKFHRVPESGRVVKDYAGAERRRAGWYARVRISIDGIDKDGKVLVGINVTVPGWLTHEQERVIMDVIDRTLTKTISDMWYRGHTESVSYLPLPPRYGNGDVYLTYLRDKDAKIVGLVENPRGFADDEEDTAELLNDVLDNNLVENPNVDTELLGWMEGLLNSAVNNALNNLET